MRQRSGPWCLLFMGVAACSADAADDGTTDDAAEADTSKESAADGTASEPTYHRDIRPVIEASCLGCHVEGGAGPFPLDTWQDVDAVRELAVAAVTSGKMPPWPASDSCRDLQGAARLAEPTRELFEQWKASGFAKGDSDEFEPPEERNVLELGEPTRMMAPPEPYTSDVAIADDYHCFLLEGVFEEETWVTALDIRPREPSQVHHVQIHKIPASSIAEAQANDDATPEPGYSCFGGPAVTGSENIFSWRPGTQPVSFAEGSAVHVAAGSGFVIQVHYNNQFLPSGEEPLSDLTTVAWWTLPEGEEPDEAIWRVMLLGPVSLPAGDSDITMEAVQPLSRLAAVNGTFVPGEIIGATPHMHTLGTRLTSTLIPPEGDQLCVIDVPEWDFGWQLDYFYEEPIPYTDQDRVGIRCVYDNSEANQPTLQGERIKPRDVSWGEGSLDEMCLNYVWFRADREAFLQALGTGGT